MIECVLFGEDQSIFMSIILSIVLLKGDAAVKTPIANVSVTLWACSCRLNCPSQSVDTS
jgi:hypothetical protein